MADTVAWYLKENDTDKLLKQGKIVRYFIERSQIIC